MGSLAGVWHRTMARPPAPDGDCAQENLPLWRLPLCEMGEAMKKGNMGVEDRDATQQSAEVEVGAAG